MLYKRPNTPGIFINKDSLFYDINQLIHVNGDGSRQYLPQNGSKNFSMISIDAVAIVQTSSYPGSIKSPHVVTLGILKLLDLDSLTIFIGGGGGGGIPE